MIFIVLFEISLEKRPGKFSNTRPNFEGKNDILEKMFHQRPDPFMRIVPTKSTFQHNTKMFSRLKSLKQLYSETSCIYIHMCLCVLKNNLSVYFRHIEHT